MNGTKTKVVARHRFLLSALVFGFPVGVQAQDTNIEPQYPSPAISVTRFSERALSLQFEGPASSNIIAIRSSQGIVVIDTESSPSLGALLKTHIEAEFPGSTIRYVINTHGHGDHTWGNQAFGDAQIIGHERVFEDMQAVAADAPADAERIGGYLERLEARRADMTPDNPEANELDRTIRYFATAKAGIEEDFQSTPPSRTFTESLDLDLGDISLHLYSFPRAHSNSDILVFCPEEALLAAGDLFVSRMRPPYFQTETRGELLRWIGRLNSLLDPGTPIRHVIPGHGQLLAEHDLTYVRDYLVSEDRRIADKQPALPILQRAMEEDGSIEALARLDSLANDEDLFLLESDLVSLGYSFLYRQSAPAAAVQVFQALTRLFPDSWNAWDCLGEASAEAGQIELAVRSYSRSLELNPDNDHAAGALDALRR